MKKDLIVEVNRLKEIMGIVSEAGVSPKNITSAIRQALKNIGVATEELASAKFISEFENSLKSKNISSILDDLEVISNKIANSATKREGLSELTSWLRDSFHLDTMLSIIKDVKPVTFQEVATKKLEGALAAPKYKGLKDKLLKAFSEGGNPKMVQRLEELQKLKPEIRLLNKSTRYFWNHWKPGAAPTPVDQSWFKTINWFGKGNRADAFNTLRRVWYRWKTPINKLQEEYNSLSKQAEENLQKPVPEDNSAIYKKMADIMTAARKWGSEDIDKLFNGTSGNPGWLSYLPPSVKEEIVTQKDWKKSLDVIADASKRNPFNPIGVELKAFKEAWPFRMPYSKTTQGFAIFKSKSDPAYRRIMNIILWKDPRSLEEVRDALITRGTKKSAIVGVMTQVFVHTLMLPTFIATLKTLSYGALSGAETLTNILGGIAGLKPVNFIDYNEQGDNTGKAFRDEWINEFKKNFDYLNWKDYVDITYVDDILIGVWDWWISGGKSGKSPEEIKAEADALFMQRLRENKAYFVDVVGCDLSKSADENKVIIANYERNRANDVVNPTPTPEPTPTAVVSPTEDEGKTFMTTFISQNPALLPPGADATTITNSFVYKVNDTDKNVLDVYLSNTETVPSYSLIKGTDGKLQLKQ